ncbi:MAG: hypothetical protein LBF60_09045, partial [Treponema sp.]|nr:hypothetical protein [Treponema sp.]
NSKQQTANSKQQTANSKQQTANSKQVYSRVTFCQAPSSIFITFFLVLYIQEPSPSASPLLNLLHKAAKPPKRGSYGGM